MEKKKSKRVRVLGNSANRKRRIILLASALIVAGAAGIYACSSSMKNVVREWDSKIYPGVIVQGVNVGGMTKEEAKDKLSGTFNDSIENKKLSITIGDNQYELIYSNIMPKYDIDKTVEEAYNYGKSGGFLKKYITIKSGKGEDNEVPISFSYSEEKLKHFEEKLQNDSAQPAKNATITTDGSNNITIIPETERTSVKLETLDQKLKESINGDPNGTDSVTVDVEATKAKVTKDDLSKIKGLIGTFSTNYASSAPGRCNNIEIATSAINGAIVMPGEVFSFNDVVARTAERGYKEAGTYVGNKVEPGIGGGICQVSTTLYRAAMKANLRSVERTNHSMTVGYAKPGLDATVSYGYLDYKFKNTYDFPIYIQGIAADKNLIYNIYGDPAALNGKTYDMANEIIETIPPETKEVPDNTLPEGMEVNEGGGMTGYRVKSYQITYENGVEVNRELISSDTYASVGIIVRKGTQPEQEAQPADPNQTETQSEQSQQQQPIAPPPVGGQ